MGRERKSSNCVMQALREQRRFHQQYALLRVLRSRDAILMEYRSCLKQVEAQVSFRQNSHSFAQPDEQGKALRNNHFGKFLYLHNHIV